MSGDGPAAVIVDPVTGDVAAVKPASTPAAATDNALVTTLSPNGNQLTDTQLRATAVPVSAASLPLPAGAATETTLALVLTIADFDARIGDVSPTPTANTVLGRLKDIYDAIVARLNTLGQKTMANSTPIVIASDQSTLAISAASLPLPTGAATETTLGTRLADATFTGRINTQGQKAMAASTPVVVASDQSTLPISAAALPLPAGAATETTLGTRLADATVTARLGTLGQKAMAGSAPVVIASDQSRLPIASEVQIDYDTTGGVQNLSVQGIALPSATGAVAGGTVANPIRTDPTGTTTQPVSNTNLDVALSTRLSESDFDTRIGNVSASPTANTVLGRLKDLYDRFIAQLPAALVGGRLDTNIGGIGGTAVVTGGVNGSQGVGGLAANAAAVAGNPLLIGGVDVSNLARRLLTTGDGRLYVSAAVAPPAAATPVNTAATGSVSGTSDNVYTIPNAANLVIQRFSGTAEVDTSGGNKIELYWDPNGTGTGMTLIRVAFCGGNIFEFGLDYKAPLVGDGTRAIRMRRTRLSGGGKEISGFWDGYY